MNILSDQVTEQDSMGPSQDRTTLPYLALASIFVVVVVVCLFIYLLAASGLSCSTWDLCRRAWTL